MSELEPREQWAEIEAQFCDRMVEEYTRQAKEWSSKMIHPDNMMMALKCAILAEANASFAYRLRQPRYIREEMERSR